MTSVDSASKSSALLIMVVDDEWQVSELFREQLESEGCNTVTAANGVQALELVAARFPQLILLDISMPEMDGLEVLRRLKGNPATKAIPVLMVTGAQDTKNVEAAFHLGAAGYVLKPVQRDQLIKKVGEALATSGYSLF